MKFRIMQNLVFECKHNLNYWNYGEYLGLGAGAVSFLKTRGEKGFLGKRIFTEADVESYVDSSISLYSSEKIDLQKAVGEYCFMSLRKTSGLGFAEFKDIFKFSFIDRYRLTLEELKSAKLIVCNEEGFFLTAKGF